MMRALLLALLAAPGCAAHRVSLVAAPRPRVELRAWPAFSFAPATVRARISVHEVTEDLYCADVAWLWGDGEISTHGEDCARWKDVRVNEDRYNGEHVYRFPGRFTVEASLWKAGRRLWRDTAPVIVAGRDGVPGGGQ
jgi:hypothetical protein